MPITDIDAVRYCNERVRPGAEKCINAFYQAQRAADQWDALDNEEGGPPTNAEKLALMELVLERAANRLWWAYQFAVDSVALWDALNIQANVPNDTTPLWDNSDRTAPDPTRSSLVGSDIRKLNWAFEKFANWLHYDPLVSDPVFLRDGLITTEVLSYAGRKDVLKMSKFGFDAPTGTHALNLVNRCKELVTEYETNTPADFNTLQLAAVNTESN